MTSGAKSEGLNRNADLLIQVEKSPDATLPIPHFAEINPLFRYVDILPHKPLRSFMIRAARSGNLAPIYGRVRRRNGQDSGELGQVIPFLYRPQIPVNPFLLRSPPPGLTARSLGRRFRDEFAGDSLLPRRVSLARIISTFMGFVLTSAGNPR
jgi:hypothetical protein